MVTILWRIGASVAAALSRRNDAVSAVIHMAKQHAATFVRISFFAMTSKGFVMCTRELEHQNNC